MYKKVKLCGSIAKSINISKINPLPKGGRNNKSDHSPDSANANINSCKQISHVEDLIETNINYNSQFITFTVDPKIDSLCASNPNSLIIHWDKFLKRLKRKIKEPNKLQFIRFLDCKLTEDKKSMRHFHLHVLFFNPIPISKIECCSLWGIGNIDITLTNKYKEQKGITTNKNFVKYLLKSYKRIYYSPFKGTKIYSSSKNLKKPIVLTSTKNPDVISEIEPMLKKETLLESSAKSDLYLGRIEKKVHHLENVKLYSKFTRS